jgi:hypothetical protein
MSLSQNYGSVSPSLLLDFANTKQLDSRITFTRASTGTFYDANTTAKAEENLLLRSQDYSATWTVTNLTPVTGKTAPDGTSTATEFTASAANAVLTQGFTAIAGSYTFSVFLRRVTGTGDIQIAADNGTWNTKVITASWARYDITQTATAGAKTAGIRVVTSGDAIEVWGAQLEQRSAVSSYTVTTTQPITNYIPVLLTAQNNVARFEHNPVTRESLGLEIEEQRTNLFLYSDDFSNAYWTKIRSSITSNTIVAPDGTLTGDKLVENTDNNSHFVSRVETTTNTNPITWSFYAKAGERPAVSFSVREGTTFTRSSTAIFDLSAGTVGAVTNAGGASGTTSITSVGNGWYRCSLTSTLGGTDTNSQMLLQLNNGSVSSYAGNGFDGVFVWGAQLETGAFPTSYIPTVASQVTRSADAASMTGANFSSWYNAGEGSLYAEYIQPATISGNRAVASITSGSAANQLVFLTDTAPGVFWYIDANSANQVALNLGAITLNAKTKVAGVYKFNDFAATKNSAAVSTDASGNVPQGVNDLRIGGRTGSSALDWSGTISKLSYYPIRLTNAQLQALTTV